MNANSRIRKELQKLKQDGGDIPGCKLSIGDSFEEFDAEIEGPPGTPYEGGNWRLKINISHNYPLVAPLFKFVTKIWHPNIANDCGIICLDVLARNWTPSMTLRTGLLSVRSLLESPEFADPLNVTASMLHNRDPAIYERTVKYWTHRYANGPFECAEYDRKLKEMQTMTKWDEVEALTYLSLHRWKDDAIYITMESDLD